MTPDLFGRKLAKVVGCEPGEMPHVLRLVEWYVAHREKLATAAERERCAGVAEGWKDTTAGRAIAEGIREGTPPPPPSPSPPTTAEEEAAALAKIPSLWDDAAIAAGVARHAKGGS